MSPEDARPTCIACWEQVAEADPRDGDKFVFSEYDRAYWTHVQKCEAEANHPWLRLLAFALATAPDELLADLHCYEFDAQFLQLAIRTANMTLSGAAHVCPRADLPTGVADIVAHRRRRRA